ncbi:MAG TPA: type II toxin-antitoxin system PemK/MazF family toxin [Candidatus Eisenbergiella intestinigallinarum]|uniref:Type II toxin-antitoxin system PemK/MazF family toxin n=1 Tax=Candidatus Eisenbergiella intestinigallinarum TaxID=2838549 RepID=A0A9D2TRK8_9FIRM|nr:type II toxin-antitoxin system PemK/MazF family toxin [Candidatus Eisenbergiella intestinigallinarum]
MSLEVQQGDILKIERIRHPVLIVSTNFFNASGEVIGCPIYEAGTESPLHIAVTADKMQGYVQCEKLALLDLKVRGHKKTGRIALNEQMNITDAIQGIFDYV